MTLPAVEFLLIAGRAVFLVFAFALAAITFTAWRRATRAQTEQVLSHTNLVLQRLAAIEGRVDATKLAIAQLGERIDRPPQPAAAVPASPSYPIAIRLAKSGASCEELMASCGLSLNEAELVQRLHGPFAAGLGVTTRAAAG